MRYFLKKMMFFLITAWVALTLNFILPRIMPGDPATTLLAKFQGKLGAEALNAIKISFGLVSLPDKMKVNHFDRKVFERLELQKMKLFEQRESLLDKLDEYRSKDTSMLSAEELHELAENRKLDEEEIKKVELFIEKAESDKSLVLENFLKDSKDKYYILKKDITPEVKSQLLTVFSSVGYKKNIILQYFDYFKRIFVGDFGISTSKYPSKVSDVLKTAVPWTLGLMGISVVVAFILGTMLGVKNAWKRESTSSGVILIGSLFLQALPYFWVAILLRYVLGFKFQWFPLYGAYTDRAVGLVKFGSILYHAFLPGLVVVIVAIGGWVLTMRNNMIYVLSDNYVSFAKARGIPDRIIKYNYAARNAILPSFTGFAMSLGSIIGGSLLTEIVFSYPGIGSLMFDAVQSLDYPLMQACFFLFTMGVLVANFIADFCYILLDPRVRTEGEGK